MSAVVEKSAPEDPGWTAQQPSSQQPPSSAILRLLPSGWVPYAELTRLHKPVGVVVIYLPYLLGALFGAITNPTPMPTWIVIVTALKLLATSFILRSAGCTWNDVVDRELDRRVSRCRLRPVARGAVKPRDGAIFFIAQMCLWCAALEAGCPGSLYTAGLVVPMVVCYPYAKRVTDYPQLMLGVTLAWGVFPGNATLGTNLSRLWKENFTIALGLWSLFTAYVIWTLIYDTIYAFQDIEDDKTSGVRSMAIAWRHKAKAALSTLAVVQIASLGSTGWSFDAGLDYYVFSCIGSAMALGVMIWYVDLQNPRACGWWFQYGILMVGGCITAGMATSWVSKICSDQNKGFGAIM